MSSKEAESTIQNVLIHLPSFSTPSSSSSSQRGDTLLDALLSAARISFKAELAASNYDGKNRPYLSDLRRTLPLLHLTILLITPTASGPASGSGSGRPHQQQYIPPNQRQQQQLSPANPHHLFRGYTTLLAISPSDINTKTRTAQTSSWSFADTITASALHQLLVYLCEIIDLSEKAGTGKLSHSLKDLFIRSAFSPLTIVRGPKYLIFDPLFIHGYFSFDIGHPKTSIQSHQTLASLMRQDHAFRS